MQAGHDANRHNKGTKDLSRQRPEQSKQWQYLCLECSFACLIRTRSVEHPYCNTRRCRLSAPVKSCNGDAQIQQSFIIVRVFPTASLCVQIPQVGFYLLFATNKLWWRQGIVYQLCCPSRMSDLYYTCCLWDIIGWEAVGANKGIE